MKKIKKRLTYVKQNSDSQIDLSSVFKVICYFPSDKILHGKSFMTGKKEE